ncbi:MAG TPA: radical SAM family heme chaperone HemW [Gammaproteobacteria bacterium]|nr:radical SAM family heme chaperone HemW [Gammaproteobacteria bacterium]
MLKNIPLSLYIHIPWCIRKCPYCDFNSHAASDELPEDLYIETLIKDLDQQINLLENRPLLSIFFGGGTPSLLTPKAIERILSQVGRRLELTENIEITLEANPGTVDEARFAGLRSAGVNRLSIGLQSLQNEKLQALGRIHNRDHALRAIDSAMKAGFLNFNLDLMHGLPQQSLEDALQDLHDALQFKPPHLSWYQLTIEPNTFFHHQPPVLPEDETLWEIQEKGKSVLQQANLNQYEISAYAEAGRECIHNKNYWEFGDYLGIGAGAHSKITDTQKQIIVRHSQLKNPRDYLDPKKKLTVSENILSEKDICFEFMLNALRLRQGVSLDLFISRTGLNIKTLEPMLSFAKEKKLMVEDQNILCATEMGQRFLNDVIGLFLP